MSSNMILMGGESVAPINYREPTAAQLQYLLHFDGNQGSTAMTEENGRNFVAQGGVALSEEYSKFGRSALRTGGSSFITRAWPTAQKIGIENFTIEMWVRADNLANVVNGLWRAATTATSANGLSLYVMADGGLAICRGASAPWLVTAPGTVKVGQWHHIALTRGYSNERTAFVLWVDGIYQADFGNSLNVADSEFAIGHAFGRNRTTSTNYAGALNGHIDEFRYTKGIALYFENFTPPNQPFTLPTA